MNLAPQQQTLKVQAAALQHQLQNSMHANPYAGSTATAAIHHEVTSLRNDIAANKNSTVLNERMKKINTMIQNDQRMHYQPPTPGVQAGHYQPGQYGNHMQTGAAMPSQNDFHPTGPTFSHDASNRMQFGLRQMSATLNQRPKF